MLLELKKSKQFLTWSGGWKYGKVVRKTSIKPWMRGKVLMCFAVLGCSWYEEGSGSLPLLIPKYGPAEKTGSREARAVPIQD